MAQSIPADIAAAIRLVVETQRQSAGIGDRPDAYQYAAKVSIACSDALQALDAVILKHLSDDEVVREDDGA